MDITPFVDSLRSDLVAAAQAGGTEAEEAAERLGVALAPAVRLALMEAISQAAAEITAEMPLGGVTVRLDGRDLAFVVDAEPPVPPPDETMEPAEDGDEKTARVSLRLPETLKTRAEELAGTASQSLNTWLVQAIRTAVQNPTHQTIDLTGFHVAAPPMPPRQTSRRLTGWL